MIPMRKYEYVIIRNDKEIGINEYGFDYLINLENVLDEIREQLKLERKIALSLNKPYTVSVIDKLLDKVKK